MAAGKHIIDAINGSCSNFITNNGVGYACSYEDHDALAILINRLRRNEI